MTMQRWLIGLAGAGLLVWAHRAYGWPGVAAVAGGLVMWLLLHVTRLMTVMQRAAQRQPQFVGGRQHQVRGHFQLLEHDVGLHEAVEQHEAVRTSGNGCSHGP